MTLQTAPAFMAAATGGKTLSLDMFSGRSLVLYFYPKDNTPGCTTEGQEFAALHAEFESAGCAVLGVSRDGLKSHEQFKSKLGLPYDLLTDHDERLCAAYGVMKMKNLYGKQVRGVERSTFVIDAQGRIAREWRGVKVPQHARQVLDFIKTLPTT